MSLFTEKFIEIQKEKGQIIPRNVACRLFGISQQALDSVIRRRGLTVYRLDRMKFLSLQEVISELARREAKKKRLAKS